jgi:hypothetical protein
VVTSTIKKSVAVIGAVVLMASFAPSFAQERLEFQFGVRAGVPTTKFLESDTSPTSARETLERANVIVGPTFGALLRDRLLIQLDAMYKPLRFQSRSVRPTDSAVFEIRGASFEFPVVFDYLFSKGKRRPFAGIGMVAGHITTGTLESHGTAGGPVETPFVGQFFLKHQLPAFIANGGMEWRTRALAIRPDVRYTHWNEKRGLAIRPDQLEITVGLSLRH